MAAAIQIAQAKANLKQQESKRHAMLDAIWRKYDQDRSGKLDQDEVAMLLSALCGDGKPCTKDEVDMVMTVSNGGHREEVSRETLSLAIDTFVKYREQAPSIQAFFAKYDKNKDGCLDESELTLLLTDLNDGHVPSPKKVQFVLHSADKKDGKINNKINPPELPFALSLWVGLQEGERKQSA